MILTQGNDSCKRILCIACVLIACCLLSLLYSCYLLTEISNGIAEQNRLLVTDASVEGKLEPQEPYHANVTVTAYTTPKHSNTATAVRAVPGWTCAVSRDLAHWLGGKVWIDGIGVRHVSDLTHERLEKRVDVLVGKTKEVADVGNKDRRVVFLGKG